jgi:hypothetical protein
MHSNKTDTEYMSYMLRMWRKRDGNGKQMWCASLEEPGSRHAESFEDANAMFAFLLRKLGITDPGELAQPDKQPQWEQQR